MTSIYLSHPDCVQHEVPPGHPESSFRLQAIETALKQLGLWDRLEHVMPPEASRAQLARVHSAQLIEQVFSAAPNTGLVALDPDTSMGAHSLSAALHAAGSLVHAVDLIMQKKAQNAFCAVRPPGHHAEYNRVMGFCLFNNVAVGAAHALEEYGLERVAILDFDVHHGNGTQDIFKNDHRVLFCSTHQHPFYPYTGAPVENKNIINNPLPAGSGSQAFRDIITGVWCPAIQEFEPQMLFVSAGFDAHRDDPLASLAFEDSDYIWISEQIIKLAKQHCQGRVIATLEGGYDPAALSRCAGSLVRTLVEA